MRCETAGNAQPFIVRLGACGRDAVMDSRGRRDRARINLGEAYEVEYWSKSLGISKERLAAIVQKVGDRVDAVRAEVAAAREQRRDADK